MKSAAIVQFLVGSLVAAIIICMLIIGISFSTVNRVSEIIANADAYVERPVTIRGVSGGSMTVPLKGGSVFRVDDAGAMMTVVSPGEAPLSGKRIVVRGRMSYLVSGQGFSAPVLRLASAMRLQSLEEFGRYLETLRIGLVVISEKQHGWYWFPWLHLVSS